MLIECIDKYFLSFAFLLMFTACQQEDDTCLDAFICDAYNSGLSVKFINDTNENISVKTIKDIYISPDPNDEQISMIDFDLMDPESEYGFYILEQTINSKETINKKLQLFNCLDQSSNTLAIELTFEDGEKLRYAGWPESYQSASGFESFGFAYLSESCKEGVQNQNAIQTDLPFSGEIPADRLRIEITVNEDRTVTMTAQ